MDAARRITGVQPGEIIDASLGDGDGPTLYGNPCSFSLALAQAATVVDRTHRLIELTMGTKTKTKTKASRPKLAPTLAATVLNEDINSGDFVALLNECVDVPSYLWDTCATSLAPHEMVRLKLMPEEAGRPLKVIAVCLPFVYAKSPSGRFETLDTRRMQLVRLNRRCAKVLWKQMRAKRR